MPIAAVAGIGAIGSIAGGLFGASSAKKAADAQAAAANHAADLQHQDAQAALDFQKQEFGTEQQNVAPWLSVGRSGLSNLANLLGILPNDSGNGLFTPPNSGSRGLTPWQDPSMLPANGAPPPNTLAPTNNANFPGNNLGHDAPPAPGGPTAPLTDTPDIKSFGASPSNPSLNAPQNNGLTNLSSLAQMPAGADQLPQQVGMGGGMNPSTLGQITPGNATTPLNPGVPPGTPGTTNLNSLVNTSLGDSGSLMQPWQFEFVAPNSVTEQNDPGYQFRLQQGDQALQNSAAARGGLLSGGTAKALDQYNQGFASNEYGNVYNRALTNYQTAYNQFQQGQSNQFNRLAALAGVGQTAAGQLNSAGVNASNNVSNLLLGSGAQIGQNLNNAGAATASGYVGAGNSIQGGLSNLTNLAQLLAFQKSGSPANPAGPSSFPTPDYGSISF